MNNLCFSYNFRDRCQASDSLQVISYYYYQVTYEKRGANRTNPSQSERNNHSITPIHWGCLFKSIGL